jgi:hypothetical protein
MLPFGNIGVTRLVSWLAALSAEIFSRPEVLWGAPRRTRSFGRAKALSARFEGTYLAADYRGSEDQRSSRRVRHPRPAGSTSSGAGYGRSAS